MDIAVDYTVVDSAVVDNTVVDSAVVDSTVFDNSVVDSTVVAVGHNSAAVPVVFPFLYYR